MPDSIEENIPINSTKNILVRKLLIIAGVPIDNFTMEEALNRIEQLIVMGRKDGRTRQVATVNADFVVNAAKDPELRHILQESDLATPDGMPLVWGARMLGVDIKERVAGADMVPALAAIAAEKNLSLYLFGSMEGIANEAAEILTTNNPGLNIVGTASPPYTSLIDIDEKYIEDIRRAKPDVLLVALGNPKQEKFISMHKHDLGAAVAIGIGGTLDFIAGKQVRAPVWMQNTGTEWLYRMFTDPKRLVQRYFHDLIGFTRFFGSQWLHMRKSKSTVDRSSKQDVVIVKNKATLNLSGRIDITNNNKLSELLEKALLQTEHIDLNLENVTFLDSVAIGTILACTRIARDREGDIRLMNVPSPLMKTLTLLKLDRFFEINETTKSHIPKTKKSVERLGENIIIPIPSIFDATSSRKLIENTLKILEPKKNLILDFSETRLLTSAGLAAIVRLNRENSKLGGDFHLKNCSDDVYRTLQLVRFDAIFSILKNE